jgi:hypothetical protein
LAIPLLLLGLGLGGFLLCRTGTDPEQRPPAAKRPPTAKGSRWLAGRTARVPRLRVARPDSGSSASPAVAPSRPDPAPAASSRLAPLLALYIEFEEDTELGPTTLREVRRILHRAQESVLREERLAKENLAEAGSPSARRQRALHEFARELRVEMPGDAAERVLAHPFPQELLAWDEPLFEASPRGIVNLRKDLVP